MGNGYSTNGYYRYFAPYSVWLQATPTIPKLYWGVYSQEERMLRLCKEIAKIVSYLDSIGAEVDEIEAQVNTLIETFADQFDDYYKEQIEQWLNDNLEQLITDHMRFVWFGLTDDGYFCAYVPSNWDNLHFDTGYDYSDQDTYGHLMLSY